MKKMTLLFSIFVSSLSYPFIMAQPSPPSALSLHEPARHWMTGNQWFTNLIANYQRGDFDNFLQKMDQSYQEAIKKGEFEFALKTQKEAAEILKKDSPDYFEKREEYNKSLDPLRLDYYNLLLKVTQDQPELLVSKIVKDYVENMKAINDKKDSFVYIYKIEYHLLPDSPLVNSLEEISDEYLVKQLIFLNALHNASSTSALGIPYGTRDSHDYKIILEIEKLKEMLKESENNPEVANQIRQVLNFYPNLLAAKHDASYINKLGSITRQPANEIERKVAEINRTFGIKNRELHSKFSIYPDLGKPAG